MRCTLSGWANSPVVLSCDDGVVLPAVPVAEHDLHELVGAVVAAVVLEMLVLAHVGGLAVVDRGHDVPGRAPVGHQVDRREHAGDVERLVIGGRVGRPEPEPAGRHPHGGQHRDRVHLDAADAVLDGVRVVAAEHVRHRQAIVEEADVELARFEHAGDVLVVFRRPAVGARLRMTPRGGEVVQFCACRNATRVICRMASSLSLAGAVAPLRAMPHHARLSSPPPLPGYTGCAER